MTRALLAWLACTGCTQVFGLEAPARAITRDAAAGDGPDMDTAPDNARVRRIDIVPAKVSGGPFDAFPLVVQLTEPWLRTTDLGGDIANEDAHDIYFSSDLAGVNRLAHEVERYNEDGAYTAWVKIPTLSTSTTFYMHYGDPSLTQSQEDAPEVWRNGYALVTHMFASSTDATGVSTLTGTAISPGTGLFGGAVSFNGADSVINAGSNDAIDGAFDNGGMVEAWVFPTGFGEAGYGRILEKGAENGWLVYMNDNNLNDSFSFAHGSNSSTYGQWTSPASSIVLNTWQHIAVVFDRDNSNNVPTLYINGASVAITQHNTPSGGFDNDTQHDLRIGNTETGDRAYAGQIDEVRLSSTSRTPGWLATQYANQSSPATFYTVSAEL